MRDITFQSAALTDEMVSRLYDAWDDLAQNAIEKNVFFFPWFIRASIPLLRPQKPLVVTVYKGDLLIGLTIMQPDTGYAKMPVSFYRTSLQYHQFLATPLVRNGYANEFFRGLGNWLDSSPHKKSFGVLSLLSGDGEIADTAINAFSSQSRLVATVEEVERPAIIGPSSSEEASIEHISKSRLKNLKRRKASLSKLGKVSVDHLSTADNAEEWLEDFIRIENSGWKHEEKTSIAENPIDMEFYREMVRAAQATNSLSFLRLSIDGVAIAYTLDLKCSSYVYCVKCAHDVNYRKYAPGVLLEYETLKKYYQPNMPIHVDSCTSPENDMLNGMWPSKAKITTLAFSKNTLLHHQIFKSVFFVKSLFNKNTVWTKGKRQ